MSIKVMTWAWGLSNMNSGEKLVLLALADHADDEGYCWPGTTGIAVKCSISRPTLNKHLHTLADLKILCVAHRQDGAGRTISNGYQLHLSGVCKACKHGTIEVKSHVYRPVAPSCPEPSPYPSPEPGTTPGEGFATEVAQPSPAPKGAKRAKVSKPAQIPFKEADRERLATKYQDQLQDVGFHIDQALNHTASLKCKSLPIYVDGWLRRETARVPRNGRPALFSAPAPPAAWPAVRVSPPLSAERQAAVEKLLERDREKERAKAK